MIKLNLRLIIKSFRVLLLFWIIFIWFTITNNPDEIIFRHIELSPIIWNSNQIINAIISLILYIFLILLVPKNNFFNSRWDSILTKITRFNFNNIYKEYSIVSSMCFLIFLLNFYSLFSFNWIPNTQNWFILIITTIFLFSIWLKIILSGGMKIFGEKIPIRWYILNFILWCFHNLRFFIRFISLPFRIIINLIVGIFLVDFAKSTIPLVRAVRIYEIFVIAVQTMVFIILANIYYSEIIILPEWKAHKPAYNFNLNLKISPWFNLFKIHSISIFSKLL